MLLCVKQNVAGSNLALCFNFFSSFFSLSSRRGAYIAGRPISLLYRSFLQGPLPIANYTRIIIPGRFWTRPPSTKNTRMASSATPLHGSLIELAIPDAHAHALNATLRTSPNTYYSQSYGSRTLRAAHTLLIIAMHNTCTEGFFSHGFKTLLICRDVDSFPVLYQAASYPGHVINC